MSSATNILSKQPKIFRNPAFKSIVELARESKILLYLVGGALRSHLFDPDLDIDNADFLVLGDARKFAERIAEILHTRSIVINPQFNTVLVPVQRIGFEFSEPRDLLRCDSAEIDLPSDPLERDLFLRDFTINALALPLSPEQGNVIDIVGGLDDLEKGLIRTPVDPDITLREDPLRILRAIRIASQLNFSIENKLLKSMHFLRQSLTKISIERRTAELLKILSNPKPSIGIKLLYVTGVLEVILPEVSALADLEQNYRTKHKDIFEHTLKVLDAVAENDGMLPTRIAALLHDVGKPATRRYDPKLGWTFHGHEVVGQRMVKKLGTSLKLPTNVAENVAKLVRLHMRPINLSDEGVTDSAVRRLGYQAGEDIEELIKLCRADVTSSDRHRVKRYLANFEKVVAHLKEVEEKDELRTFQSPVRGEVIMAETGLEPGPKVGQLKKMIEEAILDGIIPNEYDAALRYLEKIKDEVLESSRKTN